MAIKTKFNCSVAAASDAELWMKLSRCLLASTRGAFLDEACGADFAMRARVAALLGAHENSKIDLPVVDRSALTIVAEEKSGDVIGRYKLLQKIGARDRMNSLLRQ